MEDAAIHPDTLAAWERHLGNPVGDGSGLRRRLGRGDLATSFAATAATNHDSPALRMDGRWYSHGELDHAASLAASALSHLGVGPGTSGLLIAAPTPSVVVTYLALLRVGAAVALANPSLTGAELEKMSWDTDARWVFGTGPPLSAAARARLPGIAELVGLDKDDRADASLILEQLATDPVPALPISPDQPAILAFTSGTTGPAKCAPLSHRNLLASIRGVMWSWRWSQRDHLVHCLPISHQHGLGGIHASLLSGGRVTILDRFDADRLLDTVEREAATIMFAVPAIHERVLTRSAERVRALGSLRFFTSGSAPLPSEVARSLERRTGQLPVERYGTTESGLDVSNPLDGPRVPGAVGWPLPGVELAIVAGEGDPVPPGEPGEIVLRGPQVFDGYRGHGLEEAFLLDWFRTGDLGVIDAETGFLRVVGRLKELIITGGMNVYPREVEEVIRSVPGVGDVAVLGVPSERWGEEVVAFVSPPSISLDALAELISRSLAPYKRPKRIVAVEAIPRTELGKTDSAALAQSLCGRV